MKMAIAAALLAAMVTPAAAQETDWAKIRREWNQPTAPFRIIDNIYYVGTADLAAYLIVTPKGHILIDGGLEESAGQIAASIQKLGFKLGDVKIMLINHGHFDHSGGLAELKRLTGARLLASAADKPGLEAGKLDYRPELGSAPKVKVDGLLRDGSAVTLGGVTLTTILTPGHSKGSTSWTLRSGGRTILFASSITVAGQPLVPGKGYDAAVSDFRATFAKLRGVKADVYLAFHDGSFGMAAKRKRLEAGDAEAFVDPLEVKRRVDAAEAAFEAELAKQSK